MRTEDVARLLKARDNAALEDVPSRRLWRLAAKMVDLVEADTDERARRFSLLGLWESLLDWTAASNMSARVLAAELDADVDGPEMVVDALELLVRHAAARDYFHAVSAFGQCCHLLGVEQELLVLLSDGARVLREIRSPDLWRRDDAERLIRAVDANLHLSGVEFEQAMKDCLTDPPERAGSSMKAA